MTYPPVTQFQTQALEAEARAQLARERRAARATKRTSDRRGRLMAWLGVTRPGAERARLC